MTDQPVILRRAAVLAAALFALAASGALAQGAALQQKVAAIEASAAKNKQMLGHYTWQTQETISIDGDVKKTALYQVQLGPDGKPVKTEITQSQSGRQRKFGIRHRIAQSYADYGQQIASLAQSYTQFQPGRIGALYKQGNVSLQSGGVPGYQAIVVKNYVKPGDSMTLVFNPAQKAIVSLQISSYLSAPSDAVTIAAQFARLPDGTNHVASVTIDGKSKNLTIQDTNGDYQKSAAP
ncbi:MAG TPA: hypothetical protein VMH02_09460 [Verrucomicrobiae bacterium]|nr:hypothetical protein [Verrucomicrobiae bacterium]